MAIRFLFQRRLFASILLLFVASFIYTAPVQAQAAPIKKVINTVTGSKNEPAINHAETVQSLDALIKTLENNRQRQQFVVELKDLRDSLKASASQKEEPESGLLGGLINLFNSFSEEGQTPLTFWKARLDLAQTELFQILPPLQDLPPLLLNFSSIIIVWFIIAQFVAWVMRRAQRRYNLPAKLSRNASTLALLFYALQKLLPWVIAFLFVLYSSVHILPNTSLLGKSIALLMTYSVLGGGVFSAVCFILFSLLSGEHRWGALRILRDRAFRPLFAIGAFASVGDVLASPQLTLLLKENLSAVLATFNNSCAAILTGWFVITFHRPIAHLIRNRSLTYRTKRKSSFELLRFFSIIWHIPILMLVGASLLATMFSGDATAALRKAILCALLLVVALILTGLVQRHSAHILQRAKRFQNAALYTVKLIRFGYTLVTCLIWLIFTDIALRVWGSSLLQFEQGAGHEITVIAITLLFTVLCTRLVWILVDTAIYRTLTGIGRSGPSSRAQTMMPLIRNAAFSIILIIATIAALANLGMNVTPLLAGAGVIGLAIGFGAQSLVSDLITGLFIIVEDSLAIGDYVDIANHKGTVEAITIRTVSLRDIDGIVHIVPFSEIKSVKNFSRELGYAIFRISISNEMSIDDAIKAVRNVANEMRLDPILQRDIWSPIEIQGVESFDSGNAILRARFKTAPLKQFEVSRTFNLRLRRYLDEHDLDLGVPRRSIRIINETPEPVIETPENQPSLQTT